MNEDQTGVCVPMVTLLSKEDTDLVQTEASQHQLAHDLHDLKSTGSSWVTRLLADTGLLEPGSRCLLLCIADSSFASVSLVALMKYRYDISFIGLGT